MNPFFAARIHLAAFLLVIVQIMQIFKQPTKGTAVWYLRVGGGSLEGEIKVIMRVKRILGLVAHLGGHDYL